jgi:hypothetical protein
VGGGWLKYNKLEAEEEECHWHDLEAPHRDHKVATLTLFLGQALEVS